MDKNRVKGKAKDITGRMQRQAGEWTGDSETQVKGTAKQAEGKVQNLAGKMKDKARDLRDRAEEEFDRHQREGNASEEKRATVRGRRRSDRAA